MFASDSVPAILMNGLVSRAAGAKSGLRGAFTFCLVHFSPAASAMPQGHKKLVTVDGVGVESLNTCGAEFVPQGLGCNFATHSD